MGTARIKKKKKSFKALRMVVRGDFQANLWTDIMIYIPAVV